MKKTTLYTKKTSALAYNPLQPARFYDTVASETQLPSDGLPEIAFVGRSNAGKSSAINALTQQHKLAYVSKMPGRTQHLNYFSIPYTARMASVGMVAPDNAPAMIKLPRDDERSAPFVSTAEKAPCLGYLVDLPGYGYAKVGQHMKSHWSDFLTHYIMSRQMLTGVVWLMDCRHALTSIDLEFLSLLNGRPLLILLTKADKLNQSERSLIVRTVRQILLEHAIIQQGYTLDTIKHNVDVFNVLNVMNQSIKIIAFSSLSTLGHTHAIETISDWLNIEGVC